MLVTVAKNKTQTLAPGSYGTVHVSEGATLVTANVREFARVPGLSVENWEEAVD